MMMNKHPGFFHHRTGKATMRVTLRLSAPEILETKLPEKEVNRMQKKYTVFPPKSVSGDTY
ncbi:hypothetical protein, partial [Escherichia coli]|uniref:hypothetical protein n=1 Tax=Escherichia coli TaxID=562 RepID=UPI001BB4781D